MHCALFKFNLFENFVKKLIDKNYISVLITNYNYNVELINMNKVMTKIASCQSCLKFFSTFNYKIICNINKIEVKTFHLFIKAKI